MVCKWLNVCPLRELENKGKISEKWKRDYCESEDNWENCERYILEEKGVFHEWILPDGSEMSKLYEPFKERTKFLDFVGVKGKSILDVGAGSGFSSIIAAKKFGCEVTVIEPFDDKIVEAKKNAEEEGVSEKINFLKGDITNSGLGDNSFDYVICYNALHHIKKSLRSKALKEMFRIAKSGFFISELNERGVYLFDSEVHPDENHEEIKVSTEWLEKELDNLGEVGKVKKNKLTNYYELR